MEDDEAREVVESTRVFHQEYLQSGAKLGLNAARSNEVNTSRMQKNLKSDGDKVIPAENSFNFMEVAQNYAVQK